MLAEDGRDNREGVPPLLQLRSGIRAIVIIIIAVGGDGILQFTLHQLNRRQQQTRRGAADGSTRQQRPQRQLIPLPLGQCGIQALQGGLSDSVAEEEGACFDGGAEEGGGDAAVEGAEAAFWGVEGLQEAVCGAAVDGWVWLGLEADFYGVKGVFDCFAYDSGDL